MLDGDGANAVGQAGKFLQAVCLEPPVAGLPHHRLAVDQGSAQAQAVLATLAELEHPKPAIIKRHVIFELQFDERAPFTLPGHR